MPKIPGWVWLVGGAGVVAYLATRANQPAGVTPLDAHVSTDTSSGSSVPPASLPAALAPESESPVPKEQPKAAIIYKPTVQTPSPAPLPKVIMGDQVLDFLDTTAPAPPTPARAISTPGPALLIPQLIQEQPKVIQVQTPGVPVLKAAIVSKYPKLTNLVKVTPVVKAAVKAPLMTASVPKRSLLSGNYVKVTR